MNTKDSTNHKKMMDWRNQVTLIHGNTGNNTASRGGGIEITSEETLFTCPCTIEGVCSLEVLLSRGGMGTAYLGSMHDDESSRIVLKVPDMSSETNLKMFEAECAVLQELEHENIVPFRGAGHTLVNGREVPYLMMKFISGQSLRQLMNARGKLTWDEVRTVLRDMLSALNCLHEKSLCHRDIKPDNIIYDNETNHWILVDFGIAKSVNLAKLATYTMMSQDAGTWDYMAPEQLAGRDVDIRCDIYSLGKVAWELLMGTVPRAGTRLPAAAGLDVSPDVDVLIARMVEHQMEDRYQTPEDALKALNTGAQKIETWNSARRTTRKALRWAAIGGGGIGILGISWCVGNLYCEAKLKQIASHATSPIMMRTDLENAASVMPLGWGTWWMRENMPEINKKAERDLATLENEYQSLENSWATVPEQERIILLDNFLKKWQSVASTHARVLAAVSMREQEDVASLLKRAESIQIEDHGGWKQLNTEIQELKPLLTTTPAKEKMRELEARVRELNYNRRRSETATAIQNKQFTTAKEIIESLASIYGMTDELKQDRGSLLDAIYQEHTKIAEKYISNKAFLEAWRELQKFETLYPHQEQYSAQLLQGIDTNKLEVANHWRSWIVDDLRTDYQRYYEESKSFITNTDQTVYSEQQQDLKRFLCWAVHNEVAKIVQDSKSLPQARIGALAALRFEECEPVQAEYLRHLISAAQSHMGSDSNQDYLHYRYIWQRPPQDCVTVTDVTIYQLTMDYIIFDISPSFYNSVAGIGDADFKVSVYYRNKSNGEYTLIKESDSYVNTHLITIRDMVTVYIDTQCYDLVIRNSDADFFGPESHEVQVSVPSRPGKIRDSSKTDDGTRIQYTYTLK